MRRTYKRGTKARLSLSGGPHAPANMADSMEVNVGGTKGRKWHVCYAVLRYISYDRFSHILEVANHTTNLSMANLANYF